MLLQAYLYGVCILSNTVCVWLTGLPCAGKSTIAKALAEKIDCYVLDGDNLRNGINVDLGYAIEDRTENIRRTAHIARILFDAGVTPVVACITPLQVNREFARSLFPVNSYIEVYVATKLEECERRDVKGLYKRARAGEITEFTGISSPYVVPRKSEIVIHSGESVEDAVERILDTVGKRIYVEGC